MKPFDIEEGNVSTTPEAKGSKNRPLSQVAEQTAVEKAAAVLASASFLTSILALVFVGGIYVRLAAILSFLLAPYSYFQQVSNIFYLKLPVSVLG